MASYDVASKIFSTHATLSHSLFVVDRLIVLNPVALLSFVTQSLLFFFCRTLDGGGAGGWELRTSLVAAGGRLNKEGHSGWKKGCGAVAVSVDSDQRLMAVAGFVPLEFHSVDAGAAEVGAAAGAAAAVSAAGGAAGGAPCCLALAAASEGSLTVGHDTFSLAVC
jgi:hypothetical protein